MTSFKALENGVNMHTAFDIAQKIRTENPETPLIFMGYFNPFLTYGISEFMDKADSVGIDGIIIPDLPSEEAEDIARLCKGKGSCEHKNDKRFCSICTKVHTPGILRKLIRCPKNSKIY